MRTVRRSNTNTTKAANTNKAQGVQEAPGAYRVYIAGEKTRVSRVTYNYLGEKEIVTAKAYNLEGEGPIRPHILDLLLDTLDRIKDAVDLEALTAPIVIHLPDTFNQNIACENYKHWIMTGCFLNGEPVNADELEMWKEFHEIRKELDLKLIIRNISTSGSNNYSNLSGVAYVDGDCTSEAWSRVKATISKVVEEE